MEKAKSLRSSLVIYPCATCNLHCHYCNIDKNPALNKIDKLLEESFADEDYYFKRVREEFPNREQLRNIGFWGGEPLLKIERCFKLLDKTINYYPYLNSFFVSTNFSYSNWLDKISSLFNRFSYYPERDFNFTLQLSCDGPELINDKGRGEGVTKKCLNNFNLLLKKLPEILPSNVFLNISLKPTLDIETICDLDSTEKIVEYYCFFEKNFLKPVYYLGMDNVTAYKSVPNVATPIPATKELGEKFGRFCKNCKILEKEPEKYFEYYKKITPYSIKEGEEPRKILSNTYKCETLGCGYSIFSVGLLPNNLYSTCNEGFVYCDNSYINVKDNDEVKATINKKIDKKNQQICLNLEQHKKFQEHLFHFHEKGATALIGNLASMITMLSLTKHIDKKYSDIEEAVKAAKYVVEEIGICLKDNYNSTGSISMMPNGLIILLLNGALDYIME